MEPFFLRAILGGLGLAFVAAPLGCFVVWRKMAYFGDSLAHSALLGLALGALIGIDFNAGILLAFIGFSTLLTVLETKKHLALDTILGIMAHTALSLGLISIALQEDLNINLYGYLFGDILSISWNDITWIYLGGSAVLIILYFLWDSLLAVTVNQDIAAAEGISVIRVKFVFMILMAVTTVIAMKIVGILLISSLLIIPPSTARVFSKTPEQMAFFSFIIAVFSIIGGLVLSFYVDTPSGPTIVVFSAFLFSLSLTQKFIFRNNQT